MGLETKNYCAGEGQQEFNRLTNFISVRSIIYYYLFGGAVIAQSV
jgi:hypothetical protein